jgi:hypothetical protein
MCVYGVVVVVVLFSFKQIFSVTVGREDDIQSFYGKVITIFINVLFTH